MKLPQDHDNSRLIPKHCCVLHSEPLSLKMCTSPSCLFVSLCAHADGKTAEHIFIKSDTRVLFNGETSYRFHIHSSVPQGSILGPLLYVLYTSNSLTSRETTLGTFADDTAIFATH